jgi:hypothetical protein
MEWSMSKSIDLKPFLDMLRNAEIYEEERRLVTEETVLGQEDFDKYLDSRGLCDVEQVLLQFESIVERQVRDQEDAISALNDIRRVLNLDPEPTSTPQFKAPRELDPDEPLTLIEVLCLPELGGRMYADGTAEKSRTVKMYALRRQSAKAACSFTPRLAPDRTEFQEITSRNGRHGKTSRPPSTPARNRAEKQKRQHRSRQVGHQIF